ncbi:MAG: four helix bundle protein [Bacteroidia bacterium]
MNIKPKTMFDFQKLEVYQKSKRFYVDLRGMISDSKLEPFIKNQLSRAAFSVPLNLAEGSGKFTKADRKNYFTIARASVFECVAILDILNEEQEILESVYQSQLKKADELSRILYTMIKNLQS